MQTVTLGEVQKNFSKILRNIKSGEEVIVTRRGKPIAKLISLGPRTDIDWPDFYGEAIEVRGKPVSEIILEDRENRF